jgi:ribosomal protein S18 acetylase RimI-like enzyme
MYKIELVEKISKETEERMRKGLVEYESSHGIDVNYKRFSLIIRDENRIVGVLNAYTAFAEVYVDDLWIDKSYRGKGYGRKLLQALEDHFKGEGFNNINLVTSEFQAPDFYKKCGFKVEFIRINSKNPKLTKTFFIKYFEDNVQTQGIKRSESYACPL